MDMRVPVTFEKGKPECFDEYRKVFENCSLMDHYAKNPDVDVLVDWLYPYLVSGETIIAKNADGEPVGVMTYLMKGVLGAFPYLGLLGVRQDYRGKGVGSQLIDVFVGICKGVGAKKCFICVSAFNPRAKKLYQNKGFKQVGTIPNMAKQGLNEYLLMKDL